MTFNGTNNFRTIGLFFLVLLHATCRSGLSDYVEKIKASKSSSIKNQSILYDGETAARVPTPIFANIPRLPNQVFHYAAYQSKEGIYNGVEALLDVFVLDPFRLQFNNTDPIVSSSQIWIENGKNENLNSIQVGWQIYVLKTESFSPVFFISWNSKGFKDGCYNLECPEFILDKDAIVTPGDILAFPVIHLRISKDVKTGDWWLYVNHTPVGHWQKKTFPTLGTSGTVVTLGGMVSFPKNELSPPMGSGRNFSDISAPTSMIRNIKFVNATSSEQQPSPTDFTIVPDNHKCYNVSPIADSKSHDGYYFYYGGYGGCKP